MLPLPIPQRGGSIEALAAFLNLPGPDEFVLVVAWLLAALQPRRPYPLLAIAGEQGSAKTVVTKILLIDPNVAPTRAPSREERDLMIAANNGHILAFDNLSSLPCWLWRRLTAGWRDQRWASAATSSASQSTSRTWGLKSSANHSLSSRWRSWLGSAMASRNSA
jgi:hypothetical protein